jgi:cation-transporting ATPase 13A2
LPWDYRDESVEVALTGKAFRHLIDTQDCDGGFALNSVIKKGKVFARMGPDDKALLV